MAIFSGSETVALLVGLKITFPVTVLICISLLFFLLLTGIFKIIYFVIKLSLLYNSVLFIEKNILLQFQNCNNMFLYKYI